MCNEDGTLREPTLDERRTLLPGKYEEGRGSGREGVFIVGGMGMPRGCVFWPTRGVRVGVLMFGENFLAVVFRLLWKQLE